MTGCPDAGRAGRQRQLCLERSVTGCFGADASVAAEAGGPATQAGSPKNIAWAWATADYSQDKFPVANLIDGNDKTGWSIHVVDTSPHLNRTAILALRDDCRTAGERLTVTLAQRH